MDSTNINPNENQAPAASGMPEMPAPVNPVINPPAEAMAAPAPDMVAPSMAVPDMTAPAVTPEIPAAPEAPAMPVTPEAPAMPETSTAPVTPEAVAAATMPDMPEPVAPVFTPNDSVRVGETDPITMPNPPKEPDPIEEELKAPMQAAAPVPGSIGSAISVPSGDGAATVSAVLKPMPQQQNVSFNDPANAQAQQPVTAGKKKMDKKTLILLCVVAGVVVIGLVVVLVMSM